MTKSFLRAVLAGLVAAGAATAQTPPRPRTPTSTPPAPVQQVAFKQVLPAAEQNIRVQVRLLTVPVGNAAVTAVFAGSKGREPVRLTKDGLSDFLEKAAGDRKACVLQAPRMNHFDRQPMDFRCGDDVAFDTAGGTVKVFVGTACKITPTIVDEGTAVKLAVDLTSTERNGGPPTDVRNYKSLSVKRDFSLPVGGTAAMKLGTRTAVPQTATNKLAKEFETDVIALFTVEGVTPADDAPAPAVVNLAKPAAPKMLTKVFDVSDLVSPPADSPLARPSEDTALKAATAAFTKARGEQLTKIIRGAVRPDSWGRDACQVDFYPTTGGLVLNHDADALGEVGELLAALRKMPAAERFAVKESAGVLAEFVLFSVTGDRPEMRKLMDNKSPTAEQVKATLAALKTAGALEVQSRPQLMLTDRQTGFFQAGQQFPRLNGVVKGVQQVEYIPVGTVLRATPAVSECGQTIRMRLEVNLTSASETLIDLGNGQKAQPIDCQAIESELTLPTGGTKVVPLGRRKTELRIESKVPVLGDLPYVGRLFRNVGVSHVVEDRYAVVTVTRVTSAAHLHTLVKRASANMAWSVEQVRQVHPVAPPPAALPIAPPVKPKGSFSLQLGWSAKSGPTASVNVKPAPPAPAVFVPQVIRTVGVDGLERIGVDFEVRPTPPLRAAVGGGCGSCCDAPVSLMEAYKAACAAGKKDEAARLALKLLADDPTCFGRAK